MIVLTFHLISLFLFTHCLIFSGFYEFSTLSIFLIFFSTSPSYYVDCLCHCTLKSMTQERLLYRLYATGSQRILKVSHKAFLREYGVDKFLLRFLSLSFPLYPSFFSLSPCLSFSNNLTISPSLSPISRQV